MEFVYACVASFKMGLGGLGPCGFRPFDFDSKLKIENQKFTIVIFNI